MTVEIDPEVRDQRRRERDYLREAVLNALAQGAATAAELRVRIGDRPHRYEYSQIGADGTYQSHLHDEIHWHPFLQSDVQRELVRLERHGVTTRVILSGAQAHLWWLR